MLHQTRLDAPGTLHHVILRGIEKRRIVDDDKDQQNFFERLGDLAEETETKIYAWSLMTNHAHLLLRSSPSDLPKFMRWFLTVGILLAEVARLLGVFTSAISKILQRIAERKNE